MYQDLRGSKEPVEWRKVLMDSHVRLRAKFTLSLLFNGRLHTKDRF